MTPDPKPEPPKRECFCRHFIRDGLHVHDCPDRPEPPKDVASEPDYLALRAENAALKADHEGLEHDYQRIIREVIPHAMPAKDRPEDCLEPPWEVIHRLVAERDEARAEAAKLREERKRLEDILAASADFDPEQNKLDSTITARTARAMQACEVALSEGRAILRRREEKGGEARS